MNKNIAILITVILIFLAAYVLYWEGESALESAAEDFSVLAFENTNLDCKESSLSFFIRNNRKESGSYQTKIIINNEVASEKNYTIPAQSMELIHPDNEITEKICSQEKSRYEIIIKNEEKEENIYKIISI